MRILDRFESALFSPHARTAALAHGLLIAGGALVAALLVAAGGPLYGSAAFLVLVFGVLMLRDIRWGFLAVFAVIGFLPFATLPFKIGFTPTFLNVAVLAVYFVWIMRVATRRDRELTGSPIGAAVLLFMLVAFFAFANGLRFSRPTMTTIRNFAELVLAIGFFFILVNTLRTLRDAELVARLIMLAGAAAAAIAVVFYVIPDTMTIRILDALGRLGYPGGAGALRYIEDDTANPMRAIGTMVDPNVLGGFLILMTGLTVPQLVSPAPLFRRSLVALFLLVELLALYLTYSRGSLVGLAVGLLVIGVLRYRKLLPLALVGGLLLLLLPQTQAYVARFVEGIQLQDRATLMRLGEYKDALALIRRYPWFGVGFAGSPDADLYVGVSNLYLLMGEIMGVLGVLAFLIVIAGYLANLWTAWRRTATRSTTRPSTEHPERTTRPSTDHPERTMRPSIEHPERSDRRERSRRVREDGFSQARQEALLLGLAAAITGALAGGIFDHYLFNLVYPHMSVLLWTYLGLGMAVVALVPRDVTSTVKG